MREKKYYWATIPEFNNQPVIAEVLETPRKEGILWYCLTHLYRPEFIDELLKAGNPINIPCVGFADPDTIHINFDEEILFTIREDIFPRWIQEYSGYRIRPVPDYYERQTTIEVNNQRFQFTDFV